MLELLNPIKIIVTITLLLGLLFFDFKNKIHVKVLLILLICFVNELLSIIFKLKGLSINSLFNINIIIHNTLWLLIISNYLSYKIELQIVTLNLLFGIVNMLFFEGLENFNYYSFVFGALLYTIVFIYLSFSELKKENLTFFQANSYIILFSPVIFFLGMSFMLCFKSHELTSTYIFNDIKLYTFINYTVNMIYYFLINLYIYKEKK